MGGVAKAYFTGLFQYSITDIPVFVRSRIKVTSSHPSSPMTFITSEVDVVPPAECLIKWIVSLYSHCCMTQPCHLKPEIPTTNLLQVCAPPVRLVCWATVFMVYNFLGASMTETTHDYGDIWLHPV